MRITVDTNVLISATFWYGDSNEIIEKAERKEIELVLSREIIEEFARALSYKELQEKIKNKNLEMKRTIDLRGVPAGNYPTFKLFVSGNEEPAILCTPHYCTCL